MLVDSKETELERRDQKASPSAGKNIRLVCSTATVLQIGDGFIQGMILYREDGMF